MATEAQLSLVKQLDALRANQAVLADRHRLVPAEAKEDALKAIADKHTDISVLLAHIQMNLRVTRNRRFETPGRVFYLDRKDQLHIQPAKKRHFDLTTSSALMRA